MIYSSKYQTNGQLENEVIYQTFARGLSDRFDNQKVLVLVPDRTRTLPLPTLFRVVCKLLEKAKQLDFMVALGTHPPLDENELYRLFGITKDERQTVFKNIGLLNHAWNDPSALATLGIMGKDEIKSIAGSSWHESLPEKIDIRLNRAALECDHILIMGPVFPHEVVGFSGGAKYLFPGISGAEMINATHWLGALAGVVGTIGLKDTQVRAMLHAAAQRLSTPVSLAALVMDGHELAGIFIGDMIDTWSAAVEKSAQRNIIWSDKPYRRVLSCAPPMYDDLWTAAKAMYKLEPVVSPGGEVIIYSPTLDQISLVHGKYIYEAGYHILPYFLENWERYKHIPLGILAHSTHLRGSGVMVNGIEKPNVKVTLSSRVPASDCRRLNLGYLDPASVNPKDWQNRESEGILYVPRAGETLYRFRKA